jgi:hypothetical protein
MRKFNSRLVRGTFAFAAFGAALTLFVACGGSNNKPAPTPAGKQPAATAAAKTSNGAIPNLPGLPADKIQAGINKAQQARQSALKGLQGQGGQSAQSVDDDQGVRSVAAVNSEILGTWKRITGNLLNGEISSDEDVTVTFNPDGTWTVDTSSGTHGRGTYRSLGGHEYAVYDSSDKAGVYVVGNYLFMANNDGVVLFSR